MPIATLRFVFALLLLAPTAVAQQTGTCREGEAFAELDVNAVRARLYNKGNLFWDGRNAIYEVPQGGGVNSIFSSAVWIGGLVDDTLRLSANTYAQGGGWEFWPGPLDAEGDPPEDCADYDRIYEVSAADLAAYEGSGTATDDLVDWPVDLGAPFFDRDGDGAYDLAAGDRPAIWGDQMAYWVMNDAGNVHEETLSEPMGMEVRVRAFAAASPVAALRYTTFYRYELHYHGSAPLDSAYFTYFVDPDLGDYLDDYIGSDPERDLGFVYNSDNIDSEDAGGYGEAPPAQGFRFLETPDDLGMTMFGFNGASGEQDGPSTGQEYYYNMSGRWLDGAPWTFGGQGYGGDEPTDFLYPNSGTYDDPEPGYWSELCPLPDCEEPLEPSDRRFHASTGPFRMEPGDVEVVTFALVWARGEDHFDSLQQMKVASDYVERAYRLGYLDPEAPPPLEPEPLPEAYRFGAYPNPVRGGEAEVRYALPERAHVRLAVYDVLGREVAVVVEDEVEAGEHTAPWSAAGLASGVYVVHLELDGHLDGSRLVTVVR